MYYRGQIRTHPERGFTLSELLVGMGLGLLLLAVLAGLLAQLATTARDIMTRREAAQDARLALQQLQADIRMAGAFHCGQLPSPAVGLPAPWAELAAQRLPLSLNDGQLALWHGGEAWDVRPVPPGVRFQALAPLPAVRAGQWLWLGHCGGGGLLRWGRDIKPDADGLLVVPASLIPPAAESGWMLQSVALRNYRLNGAAGGVQLVASEWRGEQLEEAVLAEGLRDGRWQVLSHRPCRWSAGTTHQLPVLLALSLTSRDGERTLQVAPRLGTRCVAEGA